MQSMERARGNEVSYLQSWRAMKAAEDCARKDGHNSEWIDPFRHDPESRLDDRPHQSSEVALSTTELTEPAESSIKLLTTESSATALTSEVSVRNEEIAGMIRAGVRYRDIKKRQDEIEAPKLAAFEEAHYAYLMDELTKKGHMPRPQDDEFVKGLESFYPMPARHRR